MALDEERPATAAEAVDATVASGGDPGPLAGIPIGVKDLEDAAGFVTTHGSAAFAAGDPAAADSPLVARLVAAGCVVVGKTNTPELGWKADTDNTVFGPTRNPWNLDHTPGGSSGGSAAAIASGMVPLATGSDGGGSIRIPSSCCGLSGMKPSLGRVPSGGASPPDWQNLSTKGVDGAAPGRCGGGTRRGGRARSQRSAIVAATGGVVARGARRPEAASTRGLVTDARLRARSTPRCWPSASERSRCWRRSAPRWSRWTSVFPADPVNEWLTLSGVYNLRSLAGFRGAPVWAQLDPVLAMTLEGAERVTALDVVRADDACHTLNLRLVELFHDVRLLVTPTVATLPPPRSLEGQGMVNGIPDYNWVKFTYPFNMTRSPAASVCAGLSSSGLPVGLQLVGPQHADLVVLRSAAALEDALAFDRLAPDSVALVG